MGREKSVVKIPQNSVHVYINKYRASHQKSPRGRGLWAFEIGDEDKWFRGTYSEAKTKAVKYAADRGIRVVYVLP